MTAELAPDIRRCVADLEQCATWLRSRHVECLIQQAVADAVAKVNSPWMDRAAAAAYCRCSVSEIDRAAVANVFPTYHRAGTPLFRRDEIDQAIASGKWPKRKPTTKEQTA